MADEVFPEGARVGVVTTEPLGGMVGLLDYRAPEGGCGTGDFVEVPLGPRRVLGVVWGAGDGRFDAARLRAAIRVLDAPPMRDELRQFLARAAAYFVVWIAVAHLLRAWSVRQDQAGGHALTLRQRRLGARPE